MVQGVQKYTGCSLEVFDTNIDELMNGEIIDQIHVNKLQVGETMVRRAICEIHREAQITRSSVDKFLEHVDAHFTQIAGTIGATVVDHTWGLVRRTPSRKDYFPALKEPFGITDYLLAARVKILPGRALNIKVDPSFRDLQQILNNASREYVEKHGFTSLADYPDQYTTYTHQGVTSLVLHDIEPCIRHRSTGRNINS